ncbi:MAG: peptidylprolyl isomerase [bacterium]
MSLHTKVLLLGLLLLITALTLSNCGDKARTEQPTARVRGETLTWGDLLRRCGLPPVDSLFQQGLDSVRLADAARLWAIEEILVQEAQKRKLDQDSLFKAHLSNLRRQLLIQALYSNVQAELVVDSAEVWEEYRDHRTEFTTPHDQVDLLYIVAPTRESANQARRSLQNDADLNAILETDSQLVGETVGWVSHSDLQPKIANSVFTLVPGGISYPLKHDPGGYIVLQCRQKRTSGTTLPLEEVYDQVHSRVLLRKQQQAEKNLRDSLWIVYHPEIYSGYQP